MTISAAKVKALCTESEVALVRASRKGEIETLSPAEVKKLAAQARKLVGKWRDLKRGQSRTRSRSEGFGQADANTKLKKLIFRDALTSFETQLVKLEAKGAGKSEKAAPPTKKKHRTAEHRATRAAVRKGMTAAQDLVNSSLAAQAPAATPEPAAPAAAPERPAPKTAARAAPKKAVSKVRPKPAAIDRSKQRTALTKAKESRVVRSGKTTRVLSHVKSRGKRVQARRDARN